MPGENYHQSWSTEPPDWLEMFAEGFVKPLAPQHLFLAAQFKGSIEPVAELREFIEAVTGIECQIGRDFEGDGLRGKIVSAIASASLVMANLARLEESAAGIAAVNLNTCVEAGIALGVSSARELAGKEPLPVLLTAPERKDEEHKTKRLPFMFQNSQITWYSSEAELLGHCRRLLLPYRRRIMNYEFAKPH